MAEASSSATSSSHSPMLSYSTMPHQSNTSDPTLEVNQDREQRNRAIEKFISNAEINMATRNLRFRLSFASYKAAHNVQRLTLDDLEATPPAALMQSARTGSKRKIGATSSGSFTYSASPSPAPVTSPSKRIFNGQGMPGKTTSLYTALLTPALSIEPRIAARSPPRERRQSTPHHTITAQNGSNRARNSTISDIPRVQTKGSKSKGKARAVGKAQRQRRGNETEEDEGPTPESTEVDLKAAATLTSLLLQARSPRTSVASIHSSPRPAMANAAINSPRASMAMAALQSTHSAPILPTAKALSPISSFSTASSTSLHIPAPVSSVNEPTASEAADLMLFLATSPSPVTQSRHSHVSGKLASRGRVLFAAEDIHDSKDDMETDTNSEERANRIFGGIVTPLGDSEEGLGFSGTAKFSYDVSMARTPSPLPTPSSTQGLGASIDLIST